MILESLSFNDFEEHYQKGQRSFIYLTMLADAFTPIHVLQALNVEMQDGVMLESGLLDSDTGRYSFIGFDSMAALIVDKHNATVTMDKQFVAQHNDANDAMKLLRELTAQLNCFVPLPVKKYVSSAIGYVSYEAAQSFTNFGPYAIPPTDRDDDFHTMQFNCYRYYIVFDHQHEKVMIGQFVNCAGFAKSEYQAGMTAIQHIINTVNESQPTASAINVNMQSINASHDEEKATVDIDDKTFMAMVAKAKNDIEEGDAFQIVISRTFSTPCHAAPLQVYRALRSFSPAPFMFYMPKGMHTVMGVSPERLISVYDKQVTINPIAGTRKRYDQCNDEAIAQDLLNDSKETAEHMMLVDLARNDIGRVVKPGSIKIKKLKEVRHFSHVSHIVSEITGELSDDVDSLDALKAAFPAGTLSGAPKIRAMQIIAKLEGKPRGLYGGVVCRLDYEGNLDTCIIIRTAVVANGVATIRAGGGIVFDSDPQTEANETRAKAYSVLHAIRAANQEAAR